MTFATLERDYWHLLSAVERNRWAPTFWIPPEIERNSMQPGQIAQLLFEIELWDDEKEEPCVEVERMWVCVRSIHQWGYLGVLMNQPCCLPESDEVYLNAGAEIAFAPEHIMEIRHESEPDEFSDLDVVRNPSRRWPWIPESNAQ